VAPSHQRGQNATRRSGTPSPAATRKNCAIWSSRRSLSSAVPQGAAACGGYAFAFSVDLCRPVRGDRAFSRQVRSELAVLTLPSWRSRAGSIHDAPS